MSRSRIAPRGIGFLALAVAATASILLAPVFSPAAQAAALNSPISRSHIIARAKVWYKRHVPYSQSGTAKGAFGNVKYRRDCSGFVSMSWRISPTGLSSPNTTALSHAKYTNKIKKVHLKKGDILDHPGVHVVLFQKWANKKHTKMWLYSEANTRDDMKHYKGSLSNYKSYGAYRYKHLKK